MPFAVPGRCLAITSPASAISQPEGSLASCALVASLGMSRRSRRIAIAWSETVTPLVA